MGGNGRNSSISLKTTTKLFPCSFSFKNYDQGVQGFKLKGYFLVTGGSIKKSGMEEKFVFRPPFIPLRISLEWSSPLSKHRWELFLRGRSVVSFHVYGFMLISYEDSVPADISTTLVPFFLLSIWNCGWQCALWGQKAAYVVEVFIIRAFKIIVVLITWSSLRQTTVQ